MTIRAMLTMAETRGWSEVKVNGSAEFKREAWIEAQARGITAQGHKPSDLDRQEADRRRGERGHVPVQAGPKQDANEIKSVAGRAGEVTAPPTAQAAVPAAVERHHAEVSQPDAGLDRGNRRVSSTAPAAAPNPEQAARKALGNEAVDLMIRAQDGVDDVRTYSSADRPQPFSRVVADARYQLADAWANPNAARVMTDAGFSEKGMQRDLETGRWNALRTGLSASGVPARELDDAFAARRAADPNWYLPSHSTEPAYAPIRDRPQPSATPAVNQQPAKPDLAHEPSARNLGVVSQPPAEPQQQAPATAAPRPSQAAPVQAVEPAASAPDHRKALREATAELSPDGRLMLAAMSEKIDREMNKLNVAAKLEVKAFAATEMVKKERAEGPVVLSPELRKLATAPEPVREQKPAPQPEQPKVQREEPEPPRRSRSR